jgi:hypothetical protein
VQARGPPFGDRCVGRRTFSQNENVLRAKIRSLRTQQRAYAIDGTGSRFRQPEGCCTDSPVPATTRTS